MPRGTTKALIAFFPRLPTTKEVTPDADDEADTLDQLQRRFQPDPTHVQAVQLWVDAASEEAPRTETWDFWLLKPSATLES